MTVVSPTGEPMEDMSVKARLAMPSAISSPTDPHIGKEAANQDSGGKGEQAGPDAPGSSLSAPTTGGAETAAQPIFHDTFAAAPSAAATPAGGATATPAAHPSHAPHTHAVGPENNVQADLTTDPSGSVELQLSSDDLGTLRLEITRTGERLHVALAADRAETMDLARRHAADFIADLQQSGYSETDLSFGPRQGRQGPDTGPDDAGQGATGADPPLPAAGELRNRPGPAGQLDIRL
ncbi:MAG: flagellar hook-length control protein FliK [Paracoccaceae bacterium]